VGLLNSVFRRQLEEAAACMPMPQARLVRILAGGRTPLPLLRRFSLGVLAGAHHFPAQLIRLYRAADSPDAKLHLLENLMEEEGVVLDGRNLRQDEAGRHSRWAKRFCDALDVPAEAQQTAQAGARDAAFNEYLADGDWLCAMAYLLIGCESNLPRTYLPILQGLRRQGLDPGALVFFSAHIAADTQHGRTAMDLAERLTPVAHQVRVLDAARRGAERWWVLFNEPTAAGLSRP
jgi:hypothetical protein